MGAANVADDREDARDRRISAGTVSAKLHVGTSGWHYKHWRGLFYPRDLPASELLNFYAKHFDTVEVNNTFYQLPADTTFDSWRDNSPSRFEFAVKASRFITHMKKLKDPETSSAKFFAGVERLEKKLGPILFQLPPRWQSNLDRLEQFLNSLPPGHSYVFEFRDESWITKEMFATLRRHNVAFCIHDFADMKMPEELTADFTYIRFHGPTTAKYSGSYSDEQLQRWADRITEWQKRLKTIYVYFNNDVGGWAVKNAARLKEMIADEALILTRN